MIEQISKIEFKIDQNEKMNQENLFEHSCNKIEFFRLNL